MDLCIVLGAEGPGYSVVIDGVTYRTLPIIPTSASHLWLSSATAGALVQLPDIACKAVSIAARPTNTGYVFLGGPTVAINTGRILQPGEAIDIAIDNLSRLYFRAAVAGEGISGLWVK